MESFGTENIVMVNTMNDNYKDKFIELSAKFGLAIESGNAGVANRYVKKIIELKKKWKDKDDAYVEEIISLLEHPDKHVQLKAADALIQYRPEIARPKIEELAKEKSPLANLGSEASLILILWDRGELKFG